MKGPDAEVTILVQNNERSGPDCFLSSFGVTLSRQTQSPKLHLELNSPDYSMSARSDRCNSTPVG